MYRGKTSKKNCWTIGFSSFLDFDKKKLCFCRKVFGSVVKNTFDVSIGTLTEQDFRMQVLKTRVFLDNFWSFRDNGGTPFSGLAKQQKMSPGTVYEKIFSKGKNSLFFPIQRECLLPAKIFARVAKPAIYVSVEVFGKKHIFWNIYIIFHTSLDFGPINA